MTVTETAEYLRKLGFDARDNGEKLVVSFKETDPWFRRDQATKAIRSVCYHGKVRWIGHKRTRENYAKRRFSQKTVGNGIFSGK